MSLYSTRELYEIVRNDERLPRKLRIWLRNRISADLSAHSAVENFLIEVSKDGMKRFTEQYMMETAYDNEQQEEKDPDSEHFTGGETEDELE